MAGWGLIIDPTSEDAANVQLNINDGTNFRAFDPLDLSPPELDPIRADTSSVEGALPIENNYRNRTITIPMRIYGSSSANLATWLGRLQQKVGKINREGGTLKVTTPASLDIVFDLVAASASEELGNASAATFRAMGELTLEARPFGRGAAVQNSDHTETTLPVLVFIDDGPDGDVSALGKLVIDEDSGNDQAWFVWGLESQYLDTTDPANKALFYEAENLNALGGATPTTTPSGASGSTTNKLVVSPGLVQSFTQILGMKASTVAGAADGGGAYPGHVGTFRVFARVRTPQTNTGQVSVRLEWGDGDLLRFTENDQFDFEEDDALEANWVPIDLGVVRPSKAAQGTQQWDARIAAASTVAGDVINVDCIWLVPIAEGSGQSFAVAETPSSSVAIAARDDFDGQTVAALTGKTPPVVPAGTWNVITGSDAVDFSVVVDNYIHGSGKAIRRQELSDASTEAGRMVRMGTGSATNIIVSWSQYVSGSPINVADDAIVGFFTRMTDISNWLFCGWRFAKDSHGRFFRGIIRKRVGGTVTTLANGAKAYGFGMSLLSVRRLALSVDTAGNVTFDPGMVGKAGRTLTVAADADLKTGGVLATGGYGVYDAWASSTPSNRVIDDIAVSASSVVVAPALPASQSAELRHDRVIRENAGGTLWQPASDYEGDYLYIPPAGREARKSRIIVKASRGIPGETPGTGIDDISARLTVTPRYLVIPS